MAAVGRLSRGKPNGAPPSIIGRVGIVNSAADAPPPCSGPSGQAPNAAPARPDGGGRESPAADDAAVGAGAKRVPSGSGHGRKALFII